MMRENYAIGSDDDMPPEIEDMPTDEYLELLKQLGTKTSIVPPKFSKPATGN